MRNLKKNETKLWYSNYGKGNPILDENGDETGDYDSGYGSPFSLLYRQVKEMPMPMYLERIWTTPERYQRFRNFLLQKSLLFGSLSRL